MMLYSLRLIIFGCGVFFKHIFSYTYGLQCSRNINIKDFMQVARDVATPLILNHENDSQLNTTFCGLELTHHFTELTRICLFKVSKEGTLNECKRFIKSSLRLNFLLRMVPRGSVSECFPGSGLIWIRGTDVALEILTP